MRKKVKLNKQDPGMGLYAKAPKKKSSTGKKKVKS